LSRLSQALDADEFVITCELNPPKGTDASAMLALGEQLAGAAIAFNLTDSHASRMAMAPVPAARLLLDRGLEPIIQMTGRDRNRLALQGDLLGAAALGVENVVVMGGDPPATGDHPQAKGVFDLDAAQILAAATALGQGRDMMGNALSGWTALCLGAVVNPGAADLDAELARMERKVEAGARFFQTQAIYDPAPFERFIAAISHLPVAVLAGIIPVQSPRMARHMNAHIPGIHVPEPMVARLSAAEDPREVGIDLAIAAARTVAPMCQGLHLMPIGLD
jgi:5,10-methylenetetrahydrofolate reductase